MANEHVHYVEELGMWSFSRGRDTCKWRTPWCQKNCYFNKFYAMGWANIKWDIHYNLWWRESSAAAVAHEIARRMGTREGRFRFAIKGEIWANKYDVQKVHAVAMYLPDVKFWIPTRAWQDVEMRGHIEREAQRSNVFVMASVDPSNTEEQVAELRARKWAILFAGDNVTGQMTLGDHGELHDNHNIGMYKCEKTWEMRAGHCAVCEEGCFKRGAEVHLKKHR